MAREMKPYWPMENFFLWMRPPDFAQVRIDKNDIRAFAVSLGVLAADTRSDQALRIFVSKGIFITVHRFSALAAAFAVPKSIEYDHHARQCDAATGSNLKTRARLEAAGISPKAQSLTDVIKPTGVFNR